MNKARASLHGSAGIGVNAPRRRGAARRTDRTDVRRRQLSALVEELGGSSAPARLRLNLLRTLDQFGPLAVAEIPRAWPITREHIRRAIRWLNDDGLAQVGKDGTGSRAVRLTEDGRRVLDEIDWTETVRSMERAGEL